MRYFYNGIRSVCFLRIDATYASQRDSTKHEAARYHGHNLKIVLALTSLIEKVNLRSNPSSLKVVAPGARNQSQDREKVHIDKADSTGQFAQRRFA